MKIAAFQVPSMALVLFISDWLRSQLLQVLAEALQMLAASASDFTVSSSR